MAKHDELVYFTKRSLGGELMAVRYEHPYMGREDRIRYYSDKELPIQQVETGIVFGEAVDVYPSCYHYTEINSEQG